MSDSIRCPKCGSEQISAQKRGFSGGKAVGGVVVAGGVGALAGLHGSKEIENHCQKCGYTWSPKKQYQQDQQEKTQWNIIDFERRKQKFYDDYESGQFEYAKRFVPDEAMMIFERDGLDAAYKYLKDQDKLFEQGNVFFNLGAIAILLLIIGAIAYACS